VHGKWNDSLFFGKYVSKKKSCNFIAKFCISTKFVKRLSHFFEHRRKKAATRKKMSSPVDKVIECFFGGEDYWDKFIRCSRAIFYIEHHLHISEFHVPFEGCDTLDVKIKADIEERVSSVDAFLLEDVHTRIVAKLSALDDKFPWSEYELGADSPRQSFPPTRAGERMRAEESREREAACNLKKERLVKTAQLDYFCMLLVIDRAEDLIKHNLRHRKDTTSSLRLGRIGRSDIHVSWIQLRIAQRRSFNVLKRFEMGLYPDSVSALRELLSFLRIFVKGPDCRLLTTVHMFRLFDDLERL